MKKIVCLVIAVLFYIIGLIGVLLPIMPQIPFFVIGTIFLIIGFESIKKKVIESKLYKECLKKYVENNGLLNSIFEEK